MTEITDIEDEIYELNEHLHSTHTEMREIERDISATKSSIIQKEAELENACDHRVSNWNAAIKYVFAGCQDIDCDVCVLYDGNLDPKHKLCDKFRKHLVSSGAV